MRHCKFCGAPVIEARLTDLRLPILVNARPVRDLDGEDLPHQIYGLIALPPNRVDAAFVVAQSTILAELKGTALHRSHINVCPRRRALLAEMREGEGGREP